MLHLGIIGKERHGTIPLLWDQTTKQDPNIKERPPPPPPTTRERLPTTKEGPNLQIKDPYYNTNT